MIFKKKYEHINAPISGKKMPLELIKDEVFSKKMMGEGIAIIPTDNKVYSPVKGEITATTFTNHAVGITTSSGLEIIIHIGMDTVKLNGDGFEMHVKMGEKIEKGDLLVSFDSRYLQNGLYDMTTVLVFPNSGDKKVVPITGDELVISRETILFKIR